MFQRIAHRHRPESQGWRRSTPGTALLGTAIVSVLALAGCPSTWQTVPPPPVPAAPAIEAAPPVAGAIRYRVASAESLVVVLVYRGGTLASLGHNHVIAARALTGIVDLREPLAVSTFELHLPVAAFTVDEAGLRSSRGPGFADAVTDQARAGTRDNMLGEALLDAARFPEIVVRSVSLDGGPQDFTARLEVSVRGAPHLLDVPVQVERPDADRLHVTARFPVDQSALGLTPFSVMLGALRVEDRLGIEVDINAIRER